MANLGTHRVLGAKPEQVVATVQFTGAADVDGYGFTVGLNPGGVVNTVVKSAEGVINLKLAQQWAAVDNVVCSFDVDGYAYTFDGLTDGYQVGLTTSASGTDKDVDNTTVNATLFLRLQ